MILPCRGARGEILGPMWLPSGYAARTTLEVKRSRFVTLLARTDDEDAAREAIAAERHRYPEARHHCTAFAVSVLDSSPLLHSSDDGEPSGTAGRPMLEVLRGVPLLDTVAIVTRYFGGTLLGTGGLVRAYSDAVKECLEGALLLERHIVPVWETVLPHADGGRYLSELAGSGFTAEPEYEAEGVRARISTARGAELADLLARLSSGKASVEQIGRATIETPWGTITGGNAVRRDGNTART